MSTPEDTSPQFDLQKLRKQLEPGLSGLGLHPTDTFHNDFPGAPGGPRASLVRPPGFLRPPTDNVELVSLTRYPDGVLRWDLGGIAVPAAYKLGRAGRAALPQGEVIRQFAFERIEHNKIGDALSKLDQELSPQRGLRFWKDGQLSPFTGSDAAGRRILLFIHGTFSNCDHLFDQLGKTPASPGFQMLMAAANSGKYDHILTFDHATVGVSPAINAFDLAALLRPAPASVDIVCHSRGGLVTRWFLEGFADPAMKRRAVMVGATLGGTSLAAPYRLRSTINYLANIGEILGRLAGMAVLHPFLVAAGGLVRIVSSITKLVSNSPALDAAIAMIPGLAGQSRVGNNSEILSLQQNTGGAGQTYFAVTSDFRPRDPGWNFLEYFSKPIQRAAGYGADLIFEKPNDLVVETESMVQLASNPEPDGIRIQEIMPFGTNSEIHHTNYFLQKKTIDFIREKFVIN